MAPSYFPGDWNRTASMFARHAWAASRLLCVPGMMPARVRLATSAGESTFTVAVVCDPEAPALAAMPAVDGVQFVVVEGELRHEPAFYAHNPFEVTVEGRGILVDGWFPAQVRVASSLPPPPIPSTVRPRARGSPVAQTFAARIRTASMGALHRRAPSDSSSSWRASSAKRDVLTSAAPGASRTPASPGSSRSSDSRSSTPS